MFTDNHNTKNFQLLFDEVKKYIELQREYIKLELIEKLTVVFSKLIIFILIFLLGIVVLFYLTMSLAYLLEPLVGGLTVSYLIVAGIVALLILLIYLYRKPLIITPLVNFFANLFTNDSNK